MKTTNSLGNTMPTAHVAINKSRLKVYNTSSEPTYYLKDGSEFQIELFNPTSGTILAKIKLDGEFITQGGLVIKPGQRIFLDRYIDVAKKFLFSTYEVSGKSDEVKEAIKNNGNLVVEFFREQKRVETFRANPFNRQFNPRSVLRKSFTGGNSSGPYLGNLNSSINLVDNGNSTTNFVSYDSTFNTNTFNDFELTTTEFLSCDTPLMDSVLKTKKSKTIETGRIEEGSDSNQELIFVDKKFEIYSFYKVESKLLPESQKINTVKDLNVKSYCTQCGHKQKKGNKFCPSCGQRN